MSVSPAQARALALALPEVVEADHHGRPSYRVAGRVLATVPDDAAWHVMVGESEAHAAGAHPACSLLWWGRRLSGVRVELAQVDAALLAELLDDAWRRRAPRRLRDA